MTLFVAPRVPVLQGKPDLMNRDWYLFFQNFMDPGVQRIYERIEILAVGSDQGATFSPEQNPSEVDLAPALPLANEREDDLQFVYLLPDPAPDDLSPPSQDGFDPSNAIFTGAFGYAVGTGGVVTQATNKATAVTLNKLTGEITMNNAALAAGAIVTFVFNNSFIGAADMVVAHHQAAGTFGAYAVNSRSTGAGTGAFDITNITAGALGEAIVIKYVVIRAAIT